MIKIENVDVVGFEAAIRGMRNPMNSWDKSDSGVCTSNEYWYSISCEDCVFVKNECYVPDGTFCVGKNDLALMRKLAEAGSVHAKYRRMIVVYADITAPLYWWKEADTYKVGTVSNSCSTMHKIHEKEFTLGDFSYEHLIGPNLDELERLIDHLEDIRDWYVNYDLNKEHLNKMYTCKKDLWWQMIQLLPNSYNQRRTVMLNYEVLANIYKSRKDHKLDEWREFCGWIENLPYSKIITINGREVEE
jgi:diadenosine tetraphosphatase ApaH/serine/threonine PP2A family protein phosphatase